MSQMRGQFSGMFLLIAAFAACIASFGAYRSSKATAQSAVDTFFESQKLIREIEGFRSAPRIASLEVEPPDRIAARVTEAVSQSQLSPNSIVSVDPQAPVRIGKTDYQLRATQIAIRNASLPCLAVFVGSLEEVSEGMVVRDMSLSRSPSLGAGGEEVWNVRLTLTQVIFSPISGR